MRKNFTVRRDYTTQLHTRNVHLISLDLISADHISSSWLVATTAKWVASQHTTQFTEAPTYHSTVGSDEMEPREIKSGAMRWVIWPLLNSQLTSVKNCRTLLVRGPTARMPFIPVTCMCGSARRCSSSCHMINTTSKINTSLTAADNCYLIQI